MTKNIGNRKGNIRGNVNAIGSMNTGVNMKNTNKIGASSAGLKSGKSNAMSTYDKIRQRRNESGYGSPQMSSFGNNLMSRRNFVQGLGLVGAGVIGAGLFGSGVAKAHNPHNWAPNPDQVNIRVPDGLGGTLPALGNGTESEIWVYPTGIQSPLVPASNSYNISTPSGNSTTVSVDVRNIQWAIGLPSHTAYWRTTLTPSTLPTNGQYFELDDDGSGVGSRPPVRFVYYTTTPVPPDSTYIRNIYIGSSPTGSSPTLNSVVLDTINKINSVFDTIPPTGNDPLKLNATTPGTGIIRIYYDPGAAGNINPGTTLFTWTQVGVGRDAPSPDTGVVPGGKVVLKKTDIGGNPKSFWFQTTSFTNNIFITKACTVTGELGAVTPDFPNGIPDTMITNGSPFFVNTGTGVNVTIKNIKFVNAGVQAIDDEGRGDTTIDNCYIRDTIWSGIPGAGRVPITGHKLGGKITVKNCRIENLSQATDFGANPDTGIGIAPFGGPCEVIISNNFVSAPTGFLMAVEISVPLPSGRTYPLVPVNATIIGNTLVALSTPPGSPYSVEECLRISNVNQALIQGNTFIGQGTYGSKIVGSSNINYIGNDQLGFTASTAQILLGLTSNGNYFGSDDENGIPGNVIGPIAASGIAGIIDDGYNNSFVMNDFAMSGIQGKKYSTTNPPQVCVALSGTSHDDLVFQSGTFPTGTGGAKDQVSDLGTNNRVVGLPANHVADSKDRGIGQRLQVIKEELDCQSSGGTWNPYTQTCSCPTGMTLNLQTGHCEAPPSPPEPLTMSVEDMLAMGYVWDDANQKWVCPEGYYVDEDPESPTYGYCVQ